MTTRELRESKCQPTGTGLRGNRLEDPGIRAPTVPRRRSDAPRRRKRRVNGIHSGWRSRRRRRNQARVSRRSSRPPGELRHSCRDRSLEPRIEGSRSTLPRVDGSENAVGAIAVEGDDSRASGIQTPADGDRTPRLPRNSEISSRAVLNRRIPSAKGSSGFGTPSPANSNRSTTD